MGAKRRPLWEIIGPAPRGHLEATGKRLILDFREGKITKGDAFYQLAILLSRPVTSFMGKAFLTSDEDANDLFEDFVLHFYQNETSYDAERPLMPFLWTMARNLRQSYVRKKVVRDRLIQPLNNDQGGDHRYGDKGITASSIDAAIDAETIIDEALSCLSDEDRQIAWLYWGGEFDLLEVAAAVDRPPSTIQGRLRAIRQKFNQYAATRLHKPEVASAAIVTRGADHEV